MKIRVLLIAFASAVVAAASATAQLRDGTFEVNGFAGYLVGGHLGDVPGFVSSPYANGYRLDVEDDVNYGGRLGYNINSLFEVEVEYARTPSNLQIDPFRSNLPTVNFAPLTIQYFMGYMTFNFGRGRNVGFFTVGGGAADFSANFSDIGSRSKTYGTFAIGGGYKYFFNPHFALRFDAKFYDSAVGSRTFYCGYGYYCTGTSWVGNFVPTGGLVIAF
jgi:Outer membrane protein beta-barrel domain